MNKHIQDPTTSGPTLVRTLPFTRNNETKNLGLLVDNHYFLAVFLCCLRLPPRAATTASAAGGGAAAGAGGLDPKKLSDDHHGGFAASAAGAADAAGAAIGLSDIPVPLTAGVAGLLVNQSNIPPPRIVLRFIFLDLFIDLPFDLAILYTVPTNNYINQ